MIYMDHAATTYVYSNVADEINKMISSCWGNPSALYDFGLESKEVVETARKRIAKAIGADIGEIFFTSCSTEGNAWALSQRRQCWCSQYEHHSVSENPKTQAVVDINFMRAALEYQKEQRDFLSDPEYQPYNHVVFSHMLVNNETGEIFDLKEYAEIAHELGMIVHTDATQALGNINIDIHSLPVDIATFSGHKVHAPKGIGFIYFNKNTMKEVTPLLYGGAQENNKRAGTENVPYIHGLGLAVQKACRKTTIQKKQTYCLKLQRALFDELMKHDCGIDNDYFMIATPKKSIPSTLMLCFKNIEGETLTSMLNEDKIYLGNGSACNSGDLEPSETLKALQIPDEYIHGPVRFSFDVTNTITEVREVAKKIKKYYEYMVAFGVEEK